MVLTFEPERLIYDATERLIRIFAIDGPRSIPCAVSRAALIALEDDALAGPHAMTITYRRNRHLIREIAKRKYQAGQFESCGSVVIRLVDISDHLEGPAPAPADSAGATFLFSFPSIRESPPQSGPATASRTSAEKG